MLCCRESTDSARRVRGLDIGSVVLNGKDILSDFHYFSLDVGAKRVLARHFSAFGERGRGCGGKRQLGHRLGVSSFLVHFLGRRKRIGRVAGQ